MIFRDFCALWLTTADEVHNLNSIVITQHRHCPLASTHHFAIDFDRNAGGRQIKLADYVCQGRIALNFSRLSVYINAQTSKNLIQQDE
jgi:hypothetical protein